MRTGTYEREGVDYAGGHQLVPEEGIQALFDVVVVLVSQSRAVERI